MSLADSFNRARLSDMGRSDSTKAVREVSREERAGLEAHLAPFRKEFACWQDMFANDWEIFEFAQYEGVVSAPSIKAVLDKTLGLVLGKKCVALYGCDWCMIDVGGEWHYGIRHKTLDEPIDCSQFNRKKLERRLPKAWLRRLFEPAVPGPRS